MPPCLTVITPSFNRAEFIKDAIESVIAQQYPESEHIVVDGGSSDGTLEILSGYSHLRVLSGLDHGMYDAINKGLSVAQGEIIGLLNTDDAYEKGVFSDIVETFTMHPQIDAVIGRAAIFADGPFGKSQFEEYPRVTAETLLDQLIAGVPAINAWFFRRAVFKRIGTFDQTYSIGADRDFLIRLYLAGFIPMFADKVYYHYRRHLGSLTINPETNSQVRFMNENLRLARKYIALAQRNSTFWKRCVAWHDITSLELLILLLRQKNIRDSLQTLRFAINYNPKWLLLVARQSPTRIRNYLKKHYGYNR